MQLLCNYCAALPRQIASVPFQAPLSKHFLTAEPLRTNPRLHSNDTMSPLLYPLPYLRPLIGVPKMGQLVSERELKKKRFQSTIHLLLYHLRTYTDWWTAWPTDWLTERTEKSLSKRNMRERPLSWLTDWLTLKLTDRQTGSYMHNWQTNSQTDWLTELYRRVIT